MSGLEDFDLSYYNNTNYPLSVKEQLLKQPYTEEEAKQLRYHQFITKEFFTKNKYARGILICHGMGQGKTKLAVSIADFYRKVEPSRKVIVLLSKSLEGNFRNTVMSYTGRDKQYVDNNYKFISLNASNMFKQVSSLNKTKEEIDYEKRLSDFMDNIKQQSTLDDSLFIMDEAHNFFNAITNGAKNATNLYDMIINSKNIKLIFMTGTPIINDPFELVPCFNMLRGYIILDNTVLGADEDADSTADSIIDSTTNIDLDSNTDSNNDSTNDSTTNVDIKDTDNKSKHKSNYKPKHHDRFKKGSKKEHKSKTSDRTLLFSESFDEFNEYFVDHHNKCVKNKDKFTNRIFGLSSYYGDIYFADETKEQLASNSKTITKQGFPKKLPTIIEKVPMSDEQFAKYIIARNQELEETKSGFRGKDTRFSASAGGNSTYRVKSRQLSNYCIPEYALGPVRGAKAREKFIDKITVEDLLNTNVFSPKMGRMLHNVNQNAGRLGMMYSQFVSGEGIAIFARILEASGWNRFSLEKKVNEYDIEEKKPKKTFAILSGDIDPEERVELIKQFNNPDNVDGKHVSLLLLSGAVAEGIDLKRIRHVHILEPFWNYARINQVETRAIRYLSHTDMPEDQQNVQVYIYLSDYPKDYPKFKIKEPTTDVDLYTKSIDNMKIINSFMLALAESSIDCSLHYSNLDENVKKHVNCKLCAPTNEQLFHPLLNRDMTIPNTCRPMNEKKVEVNEFIFKTTGEKYYYKVNPKDKTQIDLYLFNKKLNGYTNMPRSYPHYGDIYSAIYSIVNEQLN